MIETLDHLTHKPRWCAAYMHNGKPQCVGGFDTDHEARRWLATHVNGRRTNA